MTYFISHMTYLYTSLHIHVHMTNFMSHMTYFVFYGVVHVTYFSSHMTNLMGSGKKTFVHIGAYYKFHFHIWGDLRDLYCFYCIFSTVC